MEFKMTPKPKPEPSVAPQKIILFPSTRIPSPTQNPRIICLIVSIIVLAIPFPLTLAFSIFSLVVLMYNGDFMGNWNHLTTIEPIYEDEVVEDTADRDY